MKKLASLLPFALFGSGLNIGPSRIYHTLEQDKKKSVMRALQEPINALLDVRYKEIKSLIHLDAQRLLKTETLAEFDKLLEEIKETKSVSPINQQLYEGIASLVDNFVTLYGGALSDADQDAERIVLMTGISLAAASQLTAQTNDNLAFVRRATNIHRALLEFTDALAEDGLAPDGSIPGESEATEQSETDRSGNDGSATI